LKEFETTQKKKIFFACQSYEKDHKHFLLEIENLRIENEALNRLRVSGDLVFLCSWSRKDFVKLFFFLLKSEVTALYKEIDGNQSDYSKKLDDMNRQLSDLNDLKNKLSNEKADLQRRNENVEYEFQQLNANFKKLHQDLDNSNLQLENEVIVNAVLIRIRWTLTSTFNLPLGNLYKVS
jgi:hypothetical protein